MKRSVFLAGAVLVSLLPACATRPPAVPQVASEAGMLVVRGGRFTMGRDKGEINERPAHKVDLDGYAIDRTEVSAAEFAEFLNVVGNDGERLFTADKYATVVIEQVDNAARDVRFKARPGAESLPANNVSWYGADAYCRWRGKRLPTEAEWEKAARGTDKRRFPWGKRPPQEGLAQFEQTWQERQFDVMVPVDALPAGASPYGVLNMAGNVLEWVGDWYRQNLLDFCSPQGETNLGLIQQLTGQDSMTQALLAPSETPQAGSPAREQESQKRQTPPRDNPTGPDTAIFKVMRGGSWLDRLDAQMSTTRRFWLDPAQRFPTTGFRCAKGSDEKEPPQAPARPAGSP